MSKRFGFRTLAASVAAALIFAGPAAAQSTPEHPPGAQMSTAPQQAPSPPPVPVQDGDYRIGAGDQIRITVFGEPELSGDYAVGGAGIVNFALVGDVELGGLTPEAAARAIEERLRDGYLQEPRVGVAIITYRPFYILGEVQRPGNYPYAPDLSIMGAVATAGGFTYRANTRWAWLKRIGHDEVRVPLNATVRVRPGDTVRVPERWF